MIQFAKEDVLGPATEMESLLELHFEECSNLKMFQLDPDWARYCALEEGGMIHVFTVRDGGILVGYAVFLLTTHMHHQGLVVANNDLFFISPDYRRGTNALKFIQYCEGQMKLLGAKRITWTVKTQHDWSALLHRAGYDTDEIALSRNL